MGVSTARRSTHGKRVPASRHRHGSQPRSSAASSTATSSTSILRQTAHSTPKSRYLMGELDASVFVLDWLATELDSVAERPPFCEVSRKAKPNTPISWSKDRTCEPRSRGWRNARTARR